MNNNSITSSNTNTHGTTDATQLTTTQPQYSAKTQSIALQLNQTYDRIQEKHKRDKDYNLLYETNNNIDNTNADFHVRSQQLECM